MKTAIYYRSGGAIQQVSKGPDEAEFESIPGLTLLLLDGDVSVVGKSVANGALVDGVVDDRTPADRLRELQAIAGQLLASSDIAVLRAYEAQTPVSPAWVSYRESLRNIIRMTEYQEVQIPQRPT